MRGATRRSREVHRHGQHISIHAPHARSDLHQRVLAINQSISIHAPHARSDVVFLRGPVPPGISIHAPHARSDCVERESKAHDAYFNPRSSCEERPDHRKCIAVAIVFQSTLLMRGATPARLKSMAVTAISIHAPHARSDVLPV